MRRAALIHWRPEDAGEGLSALRAAGWEAGLFTPQGGNLKALRDQPSHAVVIDLTRLPSHGLEVARALRQSKATRHVPLVFAAGAPDKVQRIREVLPDAVYCEWDGIAGALEQALRSAPDQPVVPVSSSGAGYSGTPLTKKLGIKDTLTLLGAPQGFARKLSLPESVRVFERAAKAHRVILFVRDASELDKGFAKALNSVDAGGGLWIAWPKKASGIQSDIGESDVREAGLAHGWVDYKVCAVDETWSGLLFGPKARAAAR
jgi:CheY-like chemotaxis protein